MQAVFDRRCSFARSLLICLLQAGCSVETPVDTGLVEYANATWWDGETTHIGSKYVKEGSFLDLGDKRPGMTIDLNGAFVTPPFAEGHNHNLMEQVFDDANKAYIEQGVFYVKAPAIYPPAIESVRYKLERPDTIDATFSMGGLTSPGGHPVNLFVNVLSGSVYDDLNYEDFAGQAFHEIHSVTDVDVAVETIESQGADFVKLLLLYAEDYEKPGFTAGPGLNPAFVAPIVEAARKRGLPVTAHVQSAYDFSVAVAAGVDEIAHLPGYSWPESRDEYRHRITDQEVNAAAIAGVAVVTSTSFPAKDGPSEARRVVIRETQFANLRKLTNAGVELRIGSDIYDRTGTGEDSYATRSEALNLVELGVLDASTVLANWIATGRAIFPKRRLGCFESGCEASFLVFEHDPRTNLAELSRIRRAVKQGLDIGQ